MLRKIRIGLATVVMIGITLLFLDFTSSLHRYLGWMAKIQFLPALFALNFGVVAVLIVLTLIFGRVYCSVICPLGIMQDLLSSLNRRKNRFRHSKELRWLRYGLLGLFVIAWIVGLGSLVALLAPYSSYGRIVQNLFQPLYILGNNLLALIAERIDSYAFYQRDVWLRSLPTFIIALVTFVAIAVLAFRGGRTYCNTVCPVGTTLSFFARFSLLRVEFDHSKCKQCSLCERNCKASCIDYKQQTVDYSRCVVCGNCLEKCRFDALHYAPRWRKVTSTEYHPSNSTDGFPSAGKAAATAGEAPIDSSRRSFLIGSALATTAAATAQFRHDVDGGLAVIEDKHIPKRQTPITPPGSVSAQNMQRHCTGCQLCVAECPNDVLRPSTDLLKLMQPTMSYERGYCRPECTRCSHVCPTGAIRTITPPEKSSIQIGHAVWVHWNCLPVSEGVSCGNCARHCPTGAITMVHLRADDPLSPMIPAVNEEKCIGCGACENLCPARPFPAIYVEGHEVHREI